MGTVVTYNDKTATPSSEIALANGDHVVLELARDGLTIKRVAAGVMGETIFQADPRTVADLCTAMVDVQAVPDPSPLRVLTTVVSQMRSAADVARAFSAAAKHTG
ncbi:MAG: hypothetical protein KDE14_13840 [Rhodobacteraceae bacterium]|nr:hypothetical protein [Paracoccaceae bacterium]